MYVSQWLWAHAHLRPHHTAVVDRPTGARLSYDQLNRAAFWHALRLQELGVERGDRVAVLAGNRPEILQLLFACARLGAVLVPLNWRLAPVEQERILADCTPRVVLVEEGQPAPDCPHCHPLCRPSLPARVPEPDWALLNPEAPLLILYTGGTTGTPKGAVLTQRSLQWNAWNTIAGWGLGPEDVAPVFTPMFHTGGLNVLATPLLCLGGTVVLPGPFEASSALRCIEEEGCTLVFMVPTMFAVLREAPDYRPG
ncbi:MAG TPA: AMP-binding protein, partial [Candidatus Nitrosotenuis sp.]|nr:AMP-binding protein [Candidatus Nitrosotenuis sp.]